MIVLDTNVLSEIHGRQHTDRILRWLDRYDMEGVFLTSITIAEIQFGLELLDPGRRRDALTQIFADIEEEFAGRILSFSARAAPIYGRIAAQRQKSGRHIETKDAMIAAICLFHGATLATRNVKDFEGLDLALVNPFEEA
ncbi:type II toxin-antitoxin system VapC family toxin [Rhizobium sp. 32-5/1]|uniref:type II toxin-antitoxin system VapC family toxin n=1 Tax=Rhizobium sp. 32-5/1 TaxID=3019602 RepID=UPI00240DDD26|nr:type II toxin-antitoxin system VapC family toxin [Rhizobium sp. 32-5/1]WEZ84735.1 type II toxin-antitoxin system VapC family toxin [Rhizobium sp. 32-5/1]